MTRACQVNRKSSRRKVSVWMFSADDVRWQASRSNMKCDDVKHNLTVRMCLEDETTCTSDDRYGGCHKPASWKSNSHNKKSKRKKMQSRDGTWVHRKPNWEAQNKAGKWTQLWTTGNMSLCGGSKGQCRSSSDGLSRYIHQNRSPSPDLTALTLHRPQLQWIYIHPDGLVVDFIWSRSGPSLPYSSPVPCTKPQTGGWNSSIHPMAPKPAFLFPQSLFSMTTSTGLQPSLEHPRWRRKIQFPINRKSYDWFSYLFMIVKVSFFLGSENIRGKYGPNYFFLM